MGPEHRDQFDDLLDGMLKRYGAVEPRAGLEGRVLAKLGGSQAKASARNRWRLGMALAALSLPLMIVVAGTISHRAAKVTPNGEPLSSKNIDTNQGNSFSLSPLETKSTRAEPQRASMRKAVNLATRSPRLDQFPSPRPLSEQEKLLLHYVRECPQQAALVAQAQAKRDKELAQVLQQEFPSAASDH